MIGHGFLKDFDDSIYLKRSLFEEEKSRIIKTILDVIPYIRETHPEALMSLDENSISEVYNTDKKLIEFLRFILETNAILYFKNVVVNQKEL